MYSQFMMHGQKNIKLCLWHSSGISHPPCVQLITPTL